MTDLLPRGEAATLWSRVQRRIDRAVAAATTTLTVVADNGGGTIIVTNSDSGNSAIRIIPHVAGLAVQPGDSVLVVRVGGRELATTNISRTSFSTTGLPDLALGASQQVLVPDSGQLGWFGGPVLMSSWAPYKLNSTGAGVDQAENLRLFLVAAATAKIPAVLIPGTYRVAERKAWPGNLTLHAHGAVIKHDLPTAVAAVLLDGVSNLAVRGLEMDGNKAGYAAATEHRHCLQVHNSHNVLFEDYRFHNAKGDGIAIGNYVAGVGNTLPSTNVLFRRGISENNHRNNLSIWVADGVVFEDAQFLNAAGTAPEDGVDIEPNLVNDICRNIIFIRCPMKGNAGSGSRVHSIGGGWATQRRVRYIDCDLEGNGGPGLQLYDAHDVQKIRGRIAGNGKDAVLFLGSGIANYGSDLILFDRTEMVDNGAGIYGQGINIENGDHGRIDLDRVYIHGNRQNGLAVLTSGSGSIDRLSLRDVEITDNSGVLAGSRHALTIGAATGVQTIDYFSVEGGQLGKPNDLVQGEAIHSEAGAVIGRGDVSGAILGAANAVDAVVIGADAQGMRFRNIRGGKFRSENEGSVMIGDGGTITHLLGDPVTGIVPRLLGVSASVAGEIATITAVSTTTITVAIKTHAGAVGTSQTIRWWAKL